MNKALLSIIIGTFVISSSGLSAATMPSSSTTSNQTTPAVSQTQSAQQVKQNAEQVQQNAQNPRQQLQQKAQEWRNSQRSMDSQAPGSQKNATTSTQGQMGSAADQDATAPQLLFIQSAKEAVVAKSADSSDRYTITLKGVDPEVAYYSEIPKRIAGKTNLQTFVSEWTNGSYNFRSGTPNGALITHFSHSAAKGESGDRMVVLSNPRYNAQSQSLTYDAQVIYGKDSLETGTHTDPVLFIDSN